MGRIKILGIAVVAVVALTALTAASASALPTWYECGKAAKVEKAYTGKFTDKACTASVETGGKYELKEGVGKGKKFKAKGGEAALHVKTWIGDNKVECASSKATGGYAAPNGMKEVVVSFSKCSVFGKTCTTTGAKPGEIKTDPLAGQLGYIEESPVNVGVKLESEAEPGGLMAEFGCEELTVKLKGAVIGELKGDTNTISKTSELVYVAAERLGEKEFEGKKFKPDVNFVGFADEMEEIEKSEKAPQVLRAIICGPFIEGLLHVECTPEAYAGLTHTVGLKGEALEAKA